MARSFSDGTGGWSLPRSSLRSGSHSRSRSGSVEMLDAEEFVDVEGGEADEGVGSRFGFTARAWKSRMGDAKIDEEWDGMEMEMEM